MSRHMWRAHARALIRSILPSAHNSAVVVVVVVVVCSTIDIDRKE